MASSGFKVKMKMNSITKILKDHGLDKDGRVQRFVRDEAKRLMTPYVPTSGGEGSPHLNGNIVYPNNRSIKYTNPYAHYQYYGKMYISPKLGVSGIPLKSGRWWSPYGETKIKTSKNLKYHTPNTGPKWDKLMLQHKGKDLEKDVQNYIKNGGKQ